VASSAGDLDRFIAAKERGGDASVEKIKMGFKEDGKGRDRHHNLRHRGENETRPSGWRKKTRQGKKKRRPRSRRCRRSRDSEERNEKRETEREVSGQYRQLMSDRFLSH